MKTKNIFFEKTSEFARMPERGTEGAAGWDLFSAEDKLLLPFRPTLVSVGFKVAIPENTLLFILPRGGRSLKTDTIIANSPGLVDEDYRGELHVIVNYIPYLDPNRSNKLRIEAGEKIAQCVLMDYHLQEWNKVDKIIGDTKRGENAFGSTGK